MKNYVATSVAILQGRGGLGAIYVFSSGNGGYAGDCCGYNGYVNSIYTIAISGVNIDGSLPRYAEECAGIMATAYSSNTVKGKVVSRSNELFSVIFPPLGILKCI